MPRPRFFRLSEDEQDRILTAAEQAFSTSGYDVSFNALIKDLGLSKGSMYYYFDDKADVFRTACLHAVQGVVDWVGGWNSPQTADGFWQEASRVYDRFTFFMLANPTSARLVWSFVEAASDPRHSQHFEEVGSQIRLWAVDLIAEGRDIGAIRTDIDADLQVEAFLSVGSALDKYLLNRLETTGEDVTSDSTSKALALVRGMLEG